MYSVPAMIASGSERSVMMKPSRSSATQSPSHAVAGSAPMKQNRPEQSTVRRSPLGVCSSVTWLRWLSPASARTSVCGEHVDAVVGFDPFDQVVRHRVDERVAPDHERHVALLLRHVDRGLARPSCRHPRRSRRSRRRCALRCRSPRSTRPRLRSVRGRRPRAAGSARPTRRSPRGSGSRCRRRARSRGSRARRAGRRLRTAR